MSKKIRSLKCLACTVEFTTIYWNKKYCGSEQCECIRRKIKQHRADGKRKINPDYKDNLRLKYLRGKERSLSLKKKKYWEDKGISLNIKIPPVPLSILNQKQRSSQRLDFDEVIDYYNQYGYTVLSDCYSNVSSNLKIKCPENHITFNRFMSFKKGHRCSKCAKKITQSSAEQELISYYRSLSPEIVTVESAKIFDDNRKELDIYFPIQKVAVEYCGLYWHSETILKSRLRPQDNLRAYHREKMDNCQKKGIRLITIFEDEYLDRPDVVRSRISYALGIINKRLFARKCIVKQLEKKQAADFLDRHHLQGNSPCKKAWGLFFEDKLESVISIGSPSRNHVSSGEHILELKRFATSPYLQIIGGGSKLYKSVTNYAVSEGYTSIVSYTDLRYAVLKNPIYEKLGFKFIRETRYTPHYVKGHRRWRNQTLRKTPQERLTNKTEWELRKEQGYDRIWDCGHRTYLHKLSNLSLKK